jgi:hypothetical protein
MEEESMSGEELVKRERKLRKMLRQIENLDEKPRQGNQLNPDVGSDYMYSTYVCLIDTTVSTTNQLHYTYKSCWGLPTAMLTSWLSWLARVCTETLISTFPDRLFFL